MINPLKLIITFYFPIVVVCIGHYVGIAYIKHIFYLPINKIINRFIISATIRIIIIVITSVLMYKANYVYDILFFIWLFLIFFVFKIIEIFKINKINKQKIRWLYLILYIKITSALQDIFNRSNLICILTIIISLLILLSMSY